MWLSGNSTPDFRGKRLKEHIKSLFSGIVLLLQESGYISLDVQYIDGTKVESASNRYTFVWHGSVEKYKAKLESKYKQSYVKLTNISSRTNRKGHRTFTGYGILCFAGKVSALTTLPNE